MLGSDAVSVVHSFKFDSDFIFIKTYNVRNTTAMIILFQCRSCVISICKADWPHDDRVISFSPLFKWLVKSILNLLLLFLVRKLRSKTRYWEQFQS